MTDVETWALSWWAIALRGVFAILFGSLALLAPNISFTALIWCFGAYAFADGVLALLAAARGARHGNRWGVLLAEGIVSMLFGFATLLAPLVTPLFLVLLVANWAIFKGLLEVAAAVRLRRVIHGEWLLALGGLLSIGLGTLLLLFPFQGGLALVAMLGGYAFSFGATLLVLGLQARRWQRNTHEPVPAW
jgi:uncharacterized membrane protein HdeD (DUF308 family)